MKRNLFLALSPSHRKGLTLMELLIVIGIVVVLAGIFWMALSPFRERSRQAQCMSNLKQIWIALQTYRDDYNGIDPDGSPREYWELGLPPVIFLLLTTGYIKDAKVTRCPNDPFNALFSYWGGWWSEITHEYSRIKFSNWVAKQGMSFPVILDGYHDYNIRSHQPWKARDGKFFMLWATLDGTITKGLYNLPWDNFPLEGEGK